MAMVSYMHGSSKNHAGIVRFGDSGYRGQHYQGKIYSSIGCKGTGGGPACHGGGEVNVGADLGSPWQAI